MFRLQLAWIQSTVGQDRQVVPVISACVTASDTVRDLGVILDGRLTMADHVAAVCRPRYYQLRQLISVARSLSAEAVKAVVHAFISSHLDDEDFRWKSKRQGRLYNIFGRILMYFNLYKYVRPNESIRCDDGYISLVDVILFVV